MAPATGVVLDTNVVLDLTVFADPGVAALRRGLDEGTLHALVNAQTLEELRLVLAYPRLGCDAAAQAAALDWYAGRATRVAEPPEDDPRPESRCPLRCRADPDDQKFLDLAWRAGARWLISKDKALLMLARAAARHGRFAIVAPADFPAA